MRLDDTLVVEIKTLEEINVPEIIVRIAEIGSQLNPHEVYASRLGVGDVMIRKLPNSIKLEIFWNDSDDKDVELFMLDIPNRAKRKLAIERALWKYLADSLLHTP